MDKLHEIVARLAPRARSAYVAGLVTLPRELERWGITPSNARLAHFMAQVLHESGGLSAQEESLNYSAERLVAVWPNRFHAGPPGSDTKRRAASEYGRRPEMIAEAVYAGRMGNDAPGDGFRYRGRGLIQITGKAMYREMSTLLAKAGVGNPDLVAMPDAVLDPRWCWAVPAAYWGSRGCGPFADKNDLEGITRRINGGLVGLGDRRNWLRKVEAVLGSP